MIQIFAHKKLFKKVCQVYFRYNTVDLVLQSKCTGKYLAHDEKLLAGNLFCQQCMKKIGHDILDS